MSHMNPSSSALEAEEALCQALLSLENVDDMRAFLLDLCTPAELTAMSDRWRVVPYILQGMPYREIYARTGVSATTVGRVARFLKTGNTGYARAARAVGLEGAEQLSLENE